MEQINLRGMAEDWFQSGDIDMGDLDFRVENMIWTKKTSKPTTQNFSRNVKISNKTDRPVLAAIHTDLSNSKSVKFVLKSDTLKGLTSGVKLPLDKSFPSEVIEEFFDQAYLDVGQPESKTRVDSQKQKSLEQTMSLSHSTAWLPFQEKEFKADFEFDLAVTGTVSTLRGNTQSFRKIVSDQRNKEDYLKKLKVGKDEVLIPVKGSARFRWVTVNSINWK